MLSRLYRVSPVHYLSVFVLLFWMLLLWSHAAVAQTAVYPYNNGGKPVPLITNDILTGSYSRTSQPFGSVGVEGIQLIVTFSATSNTCTFAPRISVFASDALGNLGSLVPDDHAIVDFGTFGALAFTYSVANLAPSYVIRAVTNASASTTCTWSLSMLPLSLDRKVTSVGSYAAGVVPQTGVYPLITGGLDATGTVRITSTDATGKLNVTITPNNSVALATPSSSPLAISASPGGTAVLTTTAANPGFNLQNVGASTLYCTIGVGAPSTAHFSASLAADSGGGVTINGDGGAWTEINSKIVPVQCISSSGTGSVAVTLK